MCYKGGMATIFGGHNNLLEHADKSIVSCCFKKDLAGLSEKEEITKYGYIRLKNISFIEMFKNLSSWR